jgi:hypothetical protein
MLDVKKRMAEIDSMYSGDGDSTPFSALIMSLPGVGKTSLFKSCPKPVLIDSFDPKGTLILEPYMKEHPGEIYVRKFWNESSKRPTEYRRWEATIEKDISDGFLNEFATYGIDTFTTQIEALTNATAMARNRADNLPAIQDYQVIYNTIRTFIKQISSQNCIFILTSHLEVVKDELTGAITAEIYTYKGLRTIVPPLFSEKYCLVLKQEKDASGHMKRVLLTDHQGIYRASTQIGSGKFAVEEEPDIKKLLQKAGLPYNDQMNLKGGVISTSAL